MSSTSKRLRWAIGIALGLHVLLALLLMGEARSRKLPEAGKAAANGGLPQVVQVDAQAPAAPTPPSPAAAPKPAPLTAPTPTATAPDGQLQLAAQGRLEATKPPELRPLSAAAATRLSLTTPEPAKLPTLAASPEPRPKRIQAPTAVAKVDPPKPPATKPAAVAAAKPAATPPRAEPTPQATRREPSPIAREEVRAARTPAVAPPNLRILPRTATSGPMAAPPPAPSAALPEVIARAPEVVTQRREPVIQIPSGKLSLKLSRPPPPPSTSGHRPALPVTAAPIAASLPPPAAAPTGVVASRVAPSFDLGIPERDELAASNGNRPLFPPPDATPRTDGSAGEPSERFPPVTIFQADDSSSVLDEALLPPEAAAPIPLRAAPVAPTSNPRLAYFQDVTTLVKAANAVALSEASGAGRKLSVRMKFSVKRDGKLLRVASAVPTPDWAVRQASQVIRSAAPFPPIPPELEGSTVELSFPVDVYAP